MSEEDLGVIDSDVEELNNVSESQEEQTQAQEEDEREAYTKRVQKKIDKLHWKHKVEIEKRDAETAELRKEIEELKKNQQSQAEDKRSSSLQDKQKELMSRRKDALEIGDYEALNNIDDQLMDIKIQFKEASKAPQRPEQRQTEQRQPEVNQAMKAWQDRNQWVFDQNQKSRLDKANQVYSQLLQEGYDEEDDDIYQELDKRLKRESPPPTGAPDRGQASGTEKGFTAEDRKMMVAFGLNPNDPAARKLWIKNKG